MGTAVGGFRARVVRLFVSPVFSALALASASLDVEWTRRNSVHPRQQPALAQPWAHGRISRVRFSILLRLREVALTRAFLRRERRKGSIGVGGEDVGG